MNGNRSAGTRWIVPWVATVLLLGCGGDAEERPEPIGSPNARWDVVEMFRADRAAERHPSDGAGKAWLESSDGPATAGRPGRWTIVFEAGPLGVVPGGYVFLEIPPFWGWSPPQASYPDLPGYTTVSAEAEEIELRPLLLDQQLLAVEISGRGLEEGDRIRFVYGAGAAGAIADRYAEHGSAFQIGVDGNGDGIRSKIAEPVTIDVGPGPPAGLVLTLPSSAKPGEAARLTIALVDAVGNAGIPVTGEVALQGVPLGLSAPASVKLLPSDAGRKTVQVVAGEPGVYRIRATGPDGIEAESNPMQVSEKGRRILWGDLQIHSNLSDGTGTPEDIYLYARDVAGLDVAALTDHDHWGILPLDDHRELWERIRSEAKRFHEPERFVTFLGYEWTNWVYGHRHVLFRGDEGSIRSSLDPDYETPGQLWDSLRGSGAITIAHHTAGEPVATDWSVPPDPAMETVVEIVSVHGSSEASDSPAPVAGAMAGQFVRDALDRGYRLGFVGSGDGHDGHPGLTHLASHTGGLAAILSEELTRAGVLQAIRNRRVYATSGPRIILEVTLDGRPIGSVLPPSPGPAELSLRVIGTGDMERVDLIRSGRVQRLLEGKGREVSIRHRMESLESGEYVYVRVVQEDGAMAWSSPFFIE
jgi:hypothetical protein